MAQCIIGYSLMDSEYSSICSVAPFASQTFNNWWFGHAALVVTFQNKYLKQSYLVDPTFVQFKDVRLYEIDGPIEHLKRHPEGNALANDLLENGVSKLSPIRAELYVASFCQGISPIENGEDAINLLRQPPPHPYHFSYGRGDERFSKHALRERGYALS